MRSPLRALLLGLVATACANEDVVLFDFRGGSAGAGATAGGFVVAAPPGGMGGMPAAGSAGSPVLPAGGTVAEAGNADMSEAGAGSTCQTDNDCEYGFSCEKKLCSDATGSCLQHPACFDQTPNPVCGCDGVTYWNDCLRKEAGIAASTPGQCGTDAKLCRSASDCGGTNPACGHLLFAPDTCGAGMMFGQHGPGPDQGPPPQGTCWALSDSCDPSTDPFRWNECGTGQTTQTATCTDTCSALSAGRFFVKSMAGACP